jgi:uncharacterized protein with HEPN domain
MQYKYLSDILESITNIDEFTRENKQFNNYDSDKMMQSAVERQIEIIGEAMKKLLDLFPNIEISNARKIINTRNKIAHGYDEIENTEIWNIIINHLPKLKNEVEELINL